MTVCVLVGTQWGDEGKGRITDLLAEQYDVIVRFQGGSNAGHTVKVGDRQYKFHLLPSGVLHEAKVCVISDGVVIEPALLLNEIEALQKAEDLKATLLVSGNAHIVTDYHKLLDRLEEQRRGERSIGTTGHGIGPAYADKYQRTGLKMSDLFEPDLLKEKVAYNVATVNVLLEHLYGNSSLEPGKICEELLRAGEKLRPFVTETKLVVQDGLREGKSFLMEGAQGTLLDIDYGTYPYVTSSHPVSSGACLGTGLKPQDISSVLGVSKAYTTRVGNGSFPTELQNSVGERMREAGKEYGATTGRPRRCGWLDIMLLRYATRINGCTDLALTKIDVLDGFDQIQVCTAYLYRGEVIRDVDFDDKVLAKCIPIYQEFPGWSRRTRSVRRREDMPYELLKLIDFVQQESGLRVKILSFGPARDEMVIL